MFIVLSHPCHLHVHGAWNTVSVPFFDQFSNPHPHPNPDHSLAIHLTNITSLFASRAYHRVYTSSYCLLSKRPSVRHLLQNDPEVGGCSKIFWCATVIVIAATTVAFSTLSSLSHPIGLLYAFDRGHLTQRLSDILSSNQILSHFSEGVRRLEESYYNNQICEDPTN